MLTRRRVLNLLIAGMNALIAAVLAAPVLGYILTPILRKSGAGEWISIGLVEDLQGGPEPRRVDFRYKNDSGYTVETVNGYAYVVQGEDSSPRILSPNCTHMGCNVAWNDERKRFLCPCHGGQYAADGRNVAGPPPRPLDRLPSRVENGVLMIQVGSHT